MKEEWIYGCLLIPNSVISFLKRRGLDTSSSVPRNGFEDGRSGLAEILGSVNCVKV